MYFVILCVDIVLNAMVLNLHLESGEGEKLQNFSHWWDFYLLKIYVRKIELMVYFSILWFYAILCIEPKRHLLKWKRYIFIKILSIFEIEKIENIFS